LGLKLSWLLDCLQLIAYIIPKKTLALMVEPSQMLCMQTHRWGLHTIQMLPAKLVKFAQYGLRKTNFYL